MKIQPKAFRSASVKDALERDGRCTVEFKGGTLTIAERSGKYEITLRDGDEKPDFWHYRRERIALDRFNELCDSLSRRRK